VRVVYTKHAEEKLLRRDVKKFKVSKMLIRKALKYPDHSSETKYGELANIIFLNRHVLRVIYDTMDQGVFKVITFHIARKGRYETKIF